MNILKTLKILPLLIIAFLLTSCSIKSPENMLSDSNNQNTDNNITHEPYTTFVATQQVISDTEDGMWRKSWFVGNDLFYITQKQNPDTKEITHFLYKSNGSQNSVLLASLNNIIPSSLAMDNTGNTHYILQEEQDYVLKKINPNGVEIFSLTLDPETTNLLQAKTGLQAAADESTYYFLTYEEAVFACETTTGAQQFLFPQLATVIQDNPSADLGLCHGINGIYLYTSKADSILLQKLTFSTAISEESIVTALPKDTSTTPNPPAEICLFSGFDKGIFVVYNNNLYSLDDESNVLEELLCQTDITAKISLENIDAINIKEDNSLFLAGYHIGRAQGLLLHVAQKQITSQKTVVIGYLKNLSATYLADFTSEFNMLRGDVQVICKQYEDLNALHLALLQGNGPDIICMYGLDINEYAQKGILENLSPYFAESATLSEEDFLPSIREIMTVDDGIRVVFPSFGLVGMVMHNDIANDKVLTTKDYLQLKIPGEKQYLCNKSAYVLQMYLLLANQEEYVDWENRTCCFDDGRFVELLKLLKDADLPNPQDETFNSIENMYSVDLFLEGNCMSIFDMHVSNLHEYQMIMDAFGDLSQFTAYPNNSQEVHFSIMESAGWLSMNSATLNKEEAWAFLEFYISEYAATRNGIYDSFSVLSDKFENQLNLTSGDMQNTYVNPYNLQTYPVRYDYTEQERDSIRNMVNHLEVLSFDAGKIGEIVFEETESFFQGDKTASDVAEIIQSRVSLYMAE